MGLTKLQNKTLIIFDIFSAFIDDSIALSLLRCLCLVHIFWYFRQWFFYAFYQRLFTYLRWCSIFCKCFFMLLPIHQYLRRYSCCTYAILIMPVLRYFCRCFCHIFADTLWYLCLHVYPILFMPIFIRVCHYGVRVQRLKFKCNCEVVHWTVNFTW